MISALEQRVHIAIQYHLILLVALTKVLQESMSMTDDGRHTLVPLSIRHLEEVKNDYMGSHVTEKALLWATVNSACQQISQ